MTTDTNKLIEIAKQCGAKEARDAAFLAGNIPLLAKQYEPLQAMVKAAIEQIESCADLGNIKLADGKGEQTILVTEDDLKIKMRLDWLSNDKKLIIDYKTTDVQSPDQWIRSIVKMGYDMQAATYVGGVSLLTGEEPKFVFAVQETTAPYAMYFVGIDTAMLEFGKMRVSRAVSIFRDCLKRGVWPIYDNRIRWPELKPWEEGEFLDKELHGQADAKEGKKPVGYDVNDANAKVNFLFGSVK
ncbi:MAG: PD-(D/E)XK nuclease-like domain-containing protein [Pseudomonadota bacterium]